MGSARSKIFSILDKQDRFLFYFLKDNNEQTTLIIYPLNYLLQYNRVNITISKMFKFLSTLPVWE